MEHLCLDPSFWAGLSWDFTVHGTLFVMPYYWAVYAELYARLHYSGVERAPCTMEELGFIRPTII